MPEHGVLAGTTDDAVAYRPARRGECRLIAGLYSISSEGIADYIWSTLARPGETLLDVGQRRYEQEESVFSYCNCTVACIEDRVAGMLVAFPTPVTPPDNDTNIDPVLLPYRRLEADNSYYICGMAVLPEYRRRGIGARFLRIAEENARALGYARMSLVVFEQNRDALRLYERNGYLEVARESIVPHPLIRMTGDALLMVKRRDARPRCF